MSRVEKAADALTIRKSEVAREILAAGLGVEGEKVDFAQEARRQSLLVSRCRPEGEALEVIADTRGWR